MGSDRPPNVEPCEPQVLIELARRGEVEALDLATRCHGERLLAVGIRYCRTPDEARDAVQDALLSAKVNLGSFRGEGTLEGWLVRMVVNACHRLSRGRKNDPALHVTDTELSAAAAGPEALTGRGEVAMALGRALEALSPQDRLVLLLAEAEDWTGPEIARELGTTPGAVRTRLSRARAKVREELGVTIGDLDDSSV